MDFFLVPDPITPDEPLVVPLSPLEPLAAHPLMTETDRLPAPPRRRPRRHRPGLDEPDQLEAISDPARLRRSPPAVRAAALGALLADRELWPQLLSGVLANPILRRLAVERLAAEITVLASRPDRDSGDQGSR
jgi:hypothetical protein